MKILLWFSKMLNPVALPYNDDIAYPTADAGKDYFEHVAVGSSDGLSNGNCFHVILESFSYIASWMTYILIIFYFVCSSYSKLKIIVIDSKKYHHPALMTFLAWNSLANVPDKIPFRLRELLLLPRAWDYRNHGIIQYSHAVAFTLWCFIP